MTTATTWRSPVDFTFHLEVHQYNWPILVDSRCKFTFNLRQLTVIDLISFHPTLINLLYHREFSCTYRMPLSAWGPGQWSPFSSWRYTHESPNSMILVENPAEAKERALSLRLGNVSFQVHLK
jgi:hypothetical protein